MIHKLKEFIVKAYARSEDVAAYDISVKLSDGVVIPDVVDISIEGDDVLITSSNGIHEFVLYTTPDNVVRWWRTRGIHK